MLSQHHGPRRTCYHLQFALLSVLLYAYALFNLLLDPPAIPVGSVFYLPEAPPCTAGDYTDAYRSYNDTLATMIGVGRCTAYDLGDAFLEKGDHGTACLLYHEGLRRHTDAASQYRGYAKLAHIYQRLNLSDTALYYAHRAFHASPGAEPLYDMAKHLEKTGQLEKAVALYTLALRAPVADDRLRTDLQRIDERLVWPRLFPPSYLEELSAAEAILDNVDLPEETQAQLHWDVIGRARPLLESGQELFRKEGRFQDGDTYYYATPSIIPHPRHPDNDHLVLVRLLNYRIDSEGRYYRDYLPPTDNSGVLRSSSALYWGHQTAAEGQELRIADRRYERTPYRFLGTEDPKLFLMDTGDIRVIWISWEYAKYVGEGSRMVSGILDVDTYTVQVDHIFPSPFGRFLEKNWVLFQVPGGPLQVVYEWHPLRVGTFDNASDTSTIRISESVIDTPRSFRHLRGSANGVIYQDELWFLVHGTTWLKGPGPVYYHRFAVFDPLTLALKRFTYPFKLESATAPVEFSLGMTIDAQGRVTIAYSVFDGSAVLRRIPLWKVEALMVPVQ